MKLGFIGLGNMGRPMVRNLANAGHQITVWNRTRDVAQAIAGENVFVADAPEECCMGDAVITMLADDKSVEQVLIKSGLISNISSSCLHVEMATISVQMAKRLEALHAQRGTGFISAPVFGRADVAALAKLFVLAAGPAALIARVQPLFDLIGQKTFVVGASPFMANVVKISGNFLVAAAIENMAEAITLARKHGVSAHDYLDVITSTLFPVPVYKVYGKMIADQVFEPALFKLPLGLKDVNLALAAGADVDAPLPTASLLRDQLMSAIARGYADKDWAALGAVVAENAGL